MKKLYVSSAILGLTALLTACGGGDTPAITHSLTVKLEGVPAAPVTVTNTSTNTQVFSGTLEGSKTFADLKAGAVFKVEGGAVNGQTSPTAQTVTLNGDKTVTLNYTALPGVALDPARVRGTLSGWAFGTGKLGVTLANSRTTVDASTPTITVSGNVDAGLPTPRATFPFLYGCDFTGQQGAVNFGAEFAFLEARTAQGDSLGEVDERTADGRQVTRVYSDTAAQLRGTAICSDSQRLDLDIRVVPGWNALSTTEINSGEYRSDYRIRNIEANARTTLSFKRAPERVDVSFRDTSALTMQAGQQVTREVALAQIGGISGQVTLETDVPGVTVEPSTINLPGVSGASLARSGLGTPGRAVQPQAVGTSLTFKADESAASYSGSLNVIVKKGGNEVGRGTLYTFSLTAPDFFLFFPSGVGTAQGFAGEQLTLPVVLNPVEGFNDAVSLTLEGAPAGVSLTPTSVQSGQVNVNLNVAADAQPGTYDVTIVGTSRTRVHRLPLHLRINPRRLTLGLGAVEGLALAGNGDLWGVQQGQGGSTLLHSSGGQVAERFPLEGAGSLTRTQFAQDGSVWVSGVHMGHLFRIQNGVVQKFFVAGGGYLAPGAEQFGLDALGRAWYIWSDGVHTPELRRLDPRTGQSITVPTVKQAERVVPVTNDRSGRYVMFMASDTSLVHVDTTTGQSAASAARLGTAGMGGVRAYMLDREGNLWAWYNGPATSLTRLDPETLAFEQQVNIDAQSNESHSDFVVVENGQTAWFGTAQTLIRRELTTGASTVFSLPGQPHETELHSLSLGPTSGVAYTFGGPSYNPSQEYLGLQR
ncbi:hypothetical protein DAERI_010465 [Deinococcus aerius]|uniref:Uncharacterized protein n=1 Tax=Deinococcus aerius TaxID=200253 RepID=A0A2I9CRU5_9DEIO|nr:hypothetical protein [Deinococcus aerius]GBF04293.1 hypothetical protein DAERI_010465 [Deinococcus aerius]